MEYIRYNSMHTTENNIFLLPTDELWAIDRSRTIKETMHLRDHIVDNLKVIDSRTVLIPSNELQKCICWVTLFHDTNVSKINEGRLKSTRYNRNFPCPHPPTPSFLTHLRRSLQIEKLLHCLTYWGSHHQYYVYIAWEQTGSRNPDRHRNTNWTPALSSHALDQQSYCMTYRTWSAAQILLLSISTQIIATQRTSHKKEA